MGSMRSKISKGVFLKRYLTLRRAGTELKVRCLEESLENYWGTLEGSAKVLRFPKESWEVLFDEAR